MRKSFRGKKTKLTGKKQFLINEKIYSPELMVIDESGNQLGAMSRYNALAEARDRDLDLVEVSPKANPPIAKLMNYGSFKYQQEKQERKAKAKVKTSDIKTIKISSRIGGHDLNLKSKQAVKFLKDGDKVRIELQLRGREHQHVDVAKEQINELINQAKIAITDQEIKTEQPIAKQGSKLSAVIAI